jgi:hypothetical protein
MAIKGKTKSRSRRVVAIPPRPPVYVRKPPFWRRRAFIVSAAVVVTLGTLTGVLLSLRSSHRKHVRQNTLTALNTLQRQIEGKFPPPPGSQATPPTGYVIYPALSADLANAASGKAKAADLEKKGKDLEKSAKASGDAIDAIVVTKVIPESASVGGVKAVSGLGATRLELNDGKRMIVTAFRIWESIGGLLQEASKLTGDDQKAVITQAQALATQAASVFRDGYQKFINVKGQLTDLGQSLNPFPQAPGGGLGG